MTVEDIRQLGHLSHANQLHHEIGQVHTTGQGKHTVTEETLTFLQLLCSLLGVPNLGSEMHACAKRNIRRTTRVKVVQSVKVVVVQRTDAIVDFTLFGTMRHP